MRISQILKITGAKCLNIEDKNVERFIIDSRQAQKGDFFVPLKGAHVDGHDFIDDAINKGAYGSFSSKNLTGKNIMLVKDTLKALTQIAKHNKTKIKTKIAITGTAGKTTTKEILALLFSNFTDTYYTQGNFNNHIGLPLTLANVNNGYELGVFELGASREGDITYLSEILKQEIGIITNVGYGHTEGFGTLKAVIKEKGNILQNTHLAVVKDDLKQFYNHKNLKTFGYDDADIIIKSTYLTEGGTVGILKYKNKLYEVFVPVFNEKIIENIAISYILFDEFGFPIEKIHEIITSYQPLQGRGNIIKHKNLIIIDETYNANPLSVKNAISTLSKLNGKKILVLGDMKELGKYSEIKHREIGEYILNSPIDTVYLYGEEVKYIYQTLKNKKEVYILSQKEIAAKIKKEKNPAYVLIKGSRSLKMENIIKLIVQ